MSRLSFDEIVLKLEQSVLPVAETWGKELERDYPNTQIKVNATHSDHHPRLPQKFSYNISVDCFEKHANKHRFGDLMLSIDLSQFGLKSDAVISAHVCMLVDEEGEGDWGMQPVFVLFPANQTVDEGILEKLNNSLPDLYQALRKALGSTGVKQVSIQ